MSILAVAALVVAVPGTVAALHLFVLAVASLFYEEKASGPVTHLRFLVVVPAHDEEAVIGDCLASLTGAARPGDTVLVVADRCTDGTAGIARSGGAVVLERPPESEPGRAAAISAGLAYARDLPWDAVVTVDADSIIEPGFFDALERRYGTGTDLVQARSEHIRQPGVLAALSEAAFALQGVTLPRGRDRLGLGTRLRGSGMSMRRPIALEREFSTAGVSEDLFYGLDLALAGITARHADSARLRSLSAPTVSAAAGQRVRWEMGRMVGARRYAGLLLRHPRRSTIDAALHLLTPPLALAVLSLAVAALLGFLGGSTGVALGAVGMLGLLAFVVGLGLIQSRAPARTWLALAAAPVYVLWKAWIQVAAVARLGEAGKAYEPTPRD